MGVYSGTPPLIHGYPNINPAEMLAAARDPNALMMALALEQQKKLPPHSMPVEMSAVTQQISEGLSQQISQAAYESVQQMMPMSTNHSMNHAIANAPQILLNAMSGSNVWRQAMPFARKSQSGPSSNDATRRSTESLSQAPIRNQRAEVSMHHPGFQSTPSSVVPNVGATYGVTLAHTLDQFSDQRQNAGRPSQPMSSEGGRRPEGMTPSARYYSETAVRPQLDFNLSVSTPISSSAISQHGLRSALQLQQQVAQSFRPPSSSDLQHIASNFSSATKTDGRTHFNDQSSSAFDRAIVPTLLKPARSNPINLGALLDRAREQQNSSPSLRPSMSNPALNTNRTPSPLSLPKNENHPANPVGVMLHRFNSDPSMFSPVANEIALDRAGSLPTGRENCSRDQNPSQDLQLAHTNRNLLRQEGAGQLIGSSLKSFKPPRGNFDLALSSGGENSRHVHSAEVMRQFNAMQAQQAQQAYNQSMRNQSVINAYHIPSDSSNGQNDQPGKS